VIAIPDHSSLGWWRLLSMGALVSAAAILMVGLFAAVGSEKLGYDFRAAYLPAAESVRDGGSPYPPPDSPIVDEERAYVYPPQLAIVLVPLTALPVDLAAALAFLAALAALMGALAVVGVRDIRCYAAVLLWAPAWNALEMANLSAALALGLGLVWRYRNEVARPALALGLAVSAKLVLWPMLVWTLATGRPRATGLAVAVGVVVTFAPWAVLGFAGLTDYPALLRRLSEIQSENSYSLVGIASALGLGEAVGRALTLAVGISLLLLCVVFARQGDELRSFTCAVAATLALSPIVWLHYLVVLLVPVAIARPRFSAIWLLPIVLWVSPRAGNGDGFETFVPALVMFVLISVLLARPRKVDVVAAPA
jgi:alpha-1,2-mannosyltransferase